jgi:hypothetical protein
LLFLSLARLPRLILRKNAWIRNDMETKIHPLSQNEKIPWIHFFSE